MTTPDQPLPPNGDPLQETEVEMDKGKPAVAAAPGKLFLILFLAGIFVFFIVYFVILGEEEKPVAEKPQEQRVPVDFAAPPPPVIEAPPPPPPAPIEPPQLDALPVAPEVPVVAANEPTSEERLERIRSNMLVFNSSDDLLTTEKDQREAEAAFSSNDPNLGFASRAVQASKAEKAKATSIGNMRTMVAQGKLIHGVLETAINTQLPGTIRAIVSRDTYAEAGNARLIPKGSRLIGVYNTDIFRGQDRVFIVWTRIIRPDGTDIEVGSPGVDQLGRAGMHGFVDSKFREIFSTAILTSLISIGVASGADALVGEDDNVTNTTTADGTTSSSGSATAQAAAQSIGNIGGVAQRVIDNVIDTRPTITIDQGTRLNVMVNRDLLFPGGALQSTTFIE